MNAEVKLEALLELEERASEEGLYQLRYNGSAEKGDVYAEVVDDGAGEQVSVEFYESPDQEHQVGIFKGNITEDEIINVLEENRREVSAPK